MAESAALSLMTTAEVAALLGVSQSWLNKLRTLGGGPPYIKLGRRVFYRRADMLAWVESRRRTSTSEEPAGPIAIPAV